MIYLDNAATTNYKPTEVINAVCDCLTKYPYNANRSAIALPLCQELLQLRKKLALVFGNVNANVVFTGGCTEALNLAILGTAKRGHVILCATEHNSVLRPIMQLYKRGIVDVSIVNPDESGQLTVERLKQVVKKDSYLLCLSQASNVTGTKQNLQQIGAFARQNGMLFLVDCAQSVGYYPTDMLKNNVDMVAIPSHKGLHAMQGAGALIFGERAKVNPIHFGGTGTESHLYYQPTTLPDGLESGTLPTPALLSISAGIDWWVHNHQQNAQNIANCVDILHQGLQSISNVKLYSQPNKSGIVSFNVGNLDSSFLCDHMAQKHDIHMRGGLHCAPTMHKYLGTENQGIARASVSCITTKEECYALLNAVEMLSKGMY